RLRRTILRIAFMFGCSGLPRRANEMLSEFRQFIVRGNVIDLAVGIIAGVVFGAVVNSLVGDVLLQVVAAIVGKPDFSAFAFTLNGSDIRYGTFLTALLNFFLAMGAVFFFIIKPLNAITERTSAFGRGTGEESEPSMRECTECLS